ncbi:unnamed protein product [Schistosoma margrebowiei]|uniref:Uncharacterized protein n=1 Tax=Schistosoma margrebowiei TaxID=48269 RepID=A0A183MC71_9TREM|nr:unnamed protein product [Schistosoma margrebowiei]
MVVGGSQQETLNPGFLLTTSNHRPPNALVRSRVGRVRSPSRNALTRPRVYSLCQESPTHCLLVALLLFTKMRGRKVIPSQWCTWAPVS